MLTDTFIKSLRPAPMPKKHFDGNGTGLHLISHPGGKRTFAIKYLHPVTRKEQTLNVGEYPTTTLKDARDQAINTRVVLAQGLDPRELRAEARMKEKATIVDTFKNLGRDWMQVRGAGWSESYRDKTETMLDRHLFSSLGAFPITQITAPQLLAVLRPIEETGKTDLAHTLMQHASAIFRFAMATARAIADPAAALRGALAPHKQENFPAITDPDEFAGEIHDGSAAVAWVNGGIGLEEVFVFGFADGHAAIFGAEDAASDRTAIAEWIAKDEDGLAEEIGGEIGEGEEGERLRGVDFEQGEIGFGGASDIAGGVGFAVVGGDGDFQFGGAFDDVFVGDDVSRGVDDEPGSEALDFLGKDAWALHGTAEELEEEVISGVTDGALDNAFGIDIDHCRHGFGDSDD